MPCSSSTDSHGTSYLIAAAPNVKDIRGRMLAGFPAIDLWWSRGSKVTEETIVIRQEYPDRATADVIECTLGQAYDLIDALTRAIESR